MNFKKYHVSRNLWSFYPEQTYGGVTLSWDGEKISYSGTCTTSYNFQIGINIKADTYTLKANANRIPIDNTASCIDIYRASPFLMVAIENSVATTGKSTFTINEDTNVILRIRLNEGVNYDGFEIRPMLNVGETPIPYEPYSSEVWHDSHYIMGTDTDTITTLPTTIYPNDTSITVGIKGQSSQSGTPSPQNPVPVNGTGERTENLFDFSAVTAGKYINADGQEVSSTGEGEAMLSHSDYIPVMPNASYAFKVTKAVNVSATSNAFCWFGANKELISRDLFDGYGSYDYIEATYTAPSGATYLIMNYRGLHGDTAMLNTGSTALPYEPYGQYKIPISMGGTTNNVYLGEVQTVRKIKKLVLTGDEDWVLSYGSFRIGVSDYYRQSGWIPFCTHYQGIDSVTGGGDLSNGQVAFLVSASANYYIYICDTNCSTAADFKAYLQQQYSNGTPVCVWYVLATPQTAVVNEPLMKIGTYADSLTTSIPVTAGSNSFDVDTTVAPSEVTATFEGWHPVQSAHERSGGAWT